MDESIATSPSDVRLTHAGLTFLLGMSATTLSGVLLLSGPIFATGLTGLIFLLLCRRFATRLLSGVHVSRSLPHRARAGESFTVNTLITADSSFPEGTTIYFTDPLSSTRKARKLKLSDIQPTALLYTGKLAQRGYLRSQHWTMRSSWPLGLYTVSHGATFQDSHSLLVHPKPFLPNRLKSHLSRLSLESFESSHEPPDPASDFRLLREFQSGDAVHRIHWPVSLRSGELHVSELEPPRPKPRCYGILIHSYEPAGQVLTPETFEMILRMATGLLSRFLREEVPIVFRHYPDKAIKLSRRTSFESTLDRLALCRRKSLSSLEPLRVTASDFQKCDEVFVLSDCPREHWEVGLREIFAQSTLIDAISLTSQSRPGLKTRLRLPA